MSVLNICLDETANVCFEAKTVFIARYPWGNTMTEKLVKFIGVSEKTKYDNNRKVILQMLWKLDNDTNKIASRGLEMLRAEFQANYILADKLSSSKK
jgi:hypothetical protein